MVNFFDPEFVYSGKKKNELETTFSNADFSDPSVIYLGNVCVRNGEWVIEKIDLTSGSVVLAFAMGRNRADYDSHWDAGGLFTPGTLVFSPINEAEPI